MFIERQTEKTKGGVLYIATLPELKRYRETIRLHRERRPVSWECIELFKMSADEMLTYPYHDFRSVILDNLTYYLLFQLYFHKEAFLQTCDDRFLSLIAQLSGSCHTTVYFVDTPVAPEMLADEDERGTVRGLLNQILNQAVSIERFYSNDKICGMTLEEGKEYLFFK